MEAMCHTTKQSNTNLSGKEKISLVGGKQNHFGKKKKEEKEFYKKKCDQFAEEEQNGKKRRREKKRKEKREKEEEEKRRRTGCSPSIFRRSVDREAKFVYATTATRRCQKRGVSPKLQEVGFLLLRFISRLGAL